MKLSYETRLEDITESAVRLFLRGKAYRTGRWRGALSCAGVFAVFAYLGFHARETVNIATICTAAAAWGTGIYLLTYKGTVRGRIRKYVAREIGDSLPHTTTLDIECGELRNVGVGTTLSFPLSELTEIKEDTLWLELSFGDKGVCVIPLRAFETAEEKTAFLAAVRTSPALSGS